MYLELRKYIYDKMLSRLNDYKKQLVAATGIKELDEIRRLAGTYSGYAQALEDFETLVKQYGEQEESS